MFAGVQCPVQKHDDAVHLTVRGERQLPSRETGADSCESGSVESGRAELTELQPASIRTAVQGHIGNEKSCRLMTSLQGQENAAE